ncbi:MAG: hypothetical protein E7271_12080 [Lachnospiraceae bacterium]|nr:hypothetical protein [Lachnospiraceae bacterium]
MKIDSSTVFMGSGRFQENTTQASRTMSYSTPKEPATVAYGSFASNYMRFQSYTGNTNRSNQDSYEPSSDFDEEISYLGSDLYSNFYMGTNGITSVRTTIQDLHEQLIKQIEELMERIKQQLLGHSYKNPEDKSVLDLTTHIGQPGTLWTRQETTFTVSEVEYTSFNTVGSVKTADGRTIDFNMSLAMGRSFTETVSEISQGVPFMLTDPLVINLDDVPETISDQQWFFDLDGDGIEEEISSLSAGNAFLALDKDGNGRIDNGKELFGATTGNGFAELAEYDEDGNGFIDENDSVFDKLKVWRKDATGKDVLSGLLASDIGAIYLGALQTPFSHTSLDDNSTRAVVRQSGFFLHESTGAAGLIQQIDFAHKDTKTA